ncbi:MAG: GNAT family N-acetyltransferase [Ginsengibacter sp.]
MDSRLNSNKIFESDRLVLRPLSLTDEDFVFNLRSNDEINKYIDREKCISREQAIEFIEKINSLGNDGLYRVIFLRKEKIAVGGVCLLRPDWTNNVCEIGYELLPKYQRQGIMVEAVKILMDFATSILKFDSIEAHIQPLNDRSSTLARKLGFSKIKEMKIKEINFEIYSYPNKNGV